MGKTDLCTIFVIYQQKCFQKQLEEDFQIIAELVYSQMARVVTARASNILVNF